MPLHPDFRKIYNKMRTQYKDKKDSNGDSVFPGVYYAWVNKHGYDDTKPFPGNKEAIVYENILATYEPPDLTESVTDNVFNESKVKEMSKKGILPEGLQLYKFKTYAAYPTKSANKRNYSKSVLMEAAHKWTGKPFIFDHDAENSEKVTGIISESSYRSDNFDGEQPKEGVWMTGVGAMSKEMFVKVHGINGFMPSIIKGGSIGAGGKAHPTAGGEEGEIDMDLLAPMEYSITAFPGIGQAEVRYEPVFLESVMSVRESAIKGQTPQVTEQAFKSITIFVNESSNNELINKGDEKLKSETIKEDLNPATPIITDNTPTTEAKPIVEPTAPVKEDLNVSVTVSKSVSVSDFKGDEPASVVVGAAKDLLCDHDEDEEPQMESEASPTEAKSVMPKEEKPGPAKDNPMPVDNPPNPTPAGYPDNNSQNSSQPSHPPEVNDANATLSLEIEQMVDDLIPEYEMVYEAKSKKWVKKAIKNPGSLRAAAKRAGVIKGDEPIPVSWLHAKAKGNSTIAKRARLALTMRSWKKEVDVSSILADEALMSKLVPEIMKMVSENEDVEPTEAPKEAPVPIEAPVHPTPDQPVEIKPVPEVKTETKTNNPPVIVKPLEVTKPEAPKEAAPVETPPVKAEPIKEVIKAPITEIIPDTIPLRADIPTLNTGKDNSIPKYKSITEVADAYYKLYGNQKDAYARVQAEILQGKWAHLKRAGEF